MRYVPPSSSRPLVLGIDLGTTNTKVALADIGPSDITLRAVVAGPTPAPAGLTDTLGRLIGQVVGNGPAPDAVGIASMAETGVPLDADGEPLGDWLRWDGRRAGREADDLAQRLGWTELVRATGVRPSAKVPLVTWAWLQANDPDRFAALARWAGVADFAGYLLTGRLATDHTLAGRTMAYRLPVDGRIADGFDSDLLAAVGLHPARLPDVCAGVIGTVRTGPFSDAGLRVGTPVTIAGHDHAVAAYAAGVRRPGEVADSVGTAEALLTIVTSAPDPATVARAGLSSVVTVDGRHRGVLAGSPGAGALVEWWLEHEAGGRPAAALFAEAAELGDEPGDVFVLPYPRGRPTPAPDPSAQLEIIGRRPDHDRARLARSLLEGLCLHARWILEEQARLAAEESRSGPVTLLGAPIAANPTWLRLKSLVHTRPFELVTEAEAGAAGAALLGAVRAGLVDGEVPSLPRRPVPAPEPRPDYEQTFAAFVAAATGGSA